MKSKMRYINKGTLVVTTMMAKVETFEDWRVDPIPVPSKSSEGSRNSGKNTITLSKTMRPSMEEGEPSAESQVDDLTSLSRGSSRRGIAIVWANRVARGRLDAAFGWQMAVEVEGAERREGNCVVRTSLRIQ